jgi:hypothetical protein
VDAAQKYSMSTPTRATQDDILCAKREILYQLERLEKRGIKVPRKFTLSSPLEEMEMEYERIKRDRDIDLSVQFQRKILMASVTGIEFMNNRFDPFDIKLDGWSDNVNDGITDYDEVLEELAQKYHGKGRIAPELKLVMMISGSAFMYHLQNSMFKSMPGIEQVLKQNPELMKQFASATMNTMAQNSSSQGDRETAGLANMFGTMFGGPSPPPPAMHPGSMGPPPPVAEGPAAKMRGPTNVDDILNELNIDPSQRMPSVARHPMSGSSSVNNDVEVMSVAESDGSLEGLLRSTGKNGGFSLNLGI